MNCMFDQLFSPIKIGTLELPNRFVVPAMDSHYTTKEHHFTEQASRYYSARVKGGFGLIITEYLCVSREGLASSTQAGIFDDDCTENLKEVVNAVHENGGFIFAQLHHAGNVANREASGMMAVGASVIPSLYQPYPVHELTTDEVYETERKFVVAAIRAKEAGFDGVEVHGAHGYLLAQFLSKSTNKRMDEFGGNIMNRARIVCDIIQGIKAACGNDYPVIVRTSGDEGFYGGNTIEDAMAQAVCFEAAGADAIHVSYGKAIMSNYTNAGFNINNVRAVKECVKIPVIGVGRINDPALASSIIASNSADLIALGRQSICDPDFPNKVKEGKTEEIYTCSGCLQRCLYTDFFEKPGDGASCMINPFSGKEGIWEIKQTNVPKKILVIGAGVAGLQAAWILGKKGHKVCVKEKASIAGGQYRLASIPPMKQDVAKTVQTYLAFCRKYSVEIQYNTKASEEDLKNYEIVIAATGATPLIPNITGIDGKNVIKANDVLEGKEILINKKILMIGAGLVGAETAEYLTRFNNKVDIVDMIKEIAPSLTDIPRVKLIENLKEADVKFYGDSRVKAIYEDGIRYENNQEEKELRGYDKIVIAFGSKSNVPEFMKEHCYIIGDAAGVGDAKKAIYEATELALGIE